MHDHSSPHFEGKAPLAHVVEAQGRGLIASAESHAEELPGHFSAAADAMRETALILLMAWEILHRAAFSAHDTLVLLSVFAGGWLLWKTGRAAWLGYQRLERLHRMMEQEQWEIEHHRQQEREELAVLYEAKGFKGKLLEEVLDVLMADDERLLKVMLEEEMGLQLGKLQHPMQNSIGAALGASLAAVIGLPALYFLPGFMVIATCLGLMGLAAGLSAAYESNRAIPAIVWNVGFGSLAYGAVHFLSQQLLG